MDALLKQSSQYFLQADTYSSCTVIIKGKAVNLGDGEGMQVPCKLKFIAIGQEKL
jgi:hypothetical protein